MYGPPPHPQQVVLATGPADAPIAWAVSLGVGAVLLVLALALRRHRIAAALGVAGETLMLTAPLLGVLPWAVYGAYPTVDKQGSLLFYLDGAHRRILLDPLHVADDPAAHLIGLHTGHLWITQAFDLVLEPFAAVNAQGLLYLVLAWLCASGLFTVLTGDRRVGFVLGLPFGLGLHLFRDLNWYTIEKAAVFVLPLYATCWLRTVRDGGRWPWLAAAVVAVGSFLNLYLGLVLGMMAAVATALLIGRALWRPPPERSRLASVLGSRSLRALLGSYVLTLVLISPLLVGQVLLLGEGRALATPECFLQTRAALDSVSLWPPAWNRLEPWRALDLVAVGLAGFGLWTRRRDPQVLGLAVLGGVAFGLSLGPYALGLPNPVYFAAWYGLPYFWRLAKPEVFFFVTWLCALGIAAIGLSERYPRTRSLVGLHLLMVALWLGLVRTHPVYPEFTAYVPAKLAPDWARRMEKTRRCELPATP